MSHYTMSYKGLAPKEADAKAIADTKDYLGAKAWEVLLYEMGRAEGHAKQANDNPAIGSAICQDMNRALWFCGVQGHPVHALGRVYYPTAYRAWMTTGPDARKLDADNFPIEEKAKANGE